MLLVAILHNLAMPALMAVCEPAACGGLREREARSAPPEEGGKLKTELKAAALRGR